MKKTLLLATFFLGLFDSLTYAWDITSITGTPDEGQTITITGTGFGTRGDNGGTYMDLGWEDFEDQNVTDVFTGTNDVSSSSTAPKNGTYHGLRDHNVSVGGVGQTSSNTNDGYFDFYWFAVPSGTTTASNSQHKEVRIGNASYGYPNFTQGKHEFTSDKNWLMAVEYSASSVDDDTSSGSGTSVNDGTYRFRISYFKPSTGVGVLDGKSYFQVSNGVKWNRSNVLTNAGSTNTFNGHWFETAYFFGYNQDGRIDDCFKDYDSKQLFICNNSTLASSSIAYPLRIRTWTDTSISGDIKEVGTMTGTAYLIGRDFDTGDEDFLAVTIGAAGDNSAPALSFTTQADGATGIDTAADIVFTLQDDVSLMNNLTVCRTKIGSTFTTETTNLTHSGTLATGLYTYTLKAARRTTVFANDNVVYLNCQGKDNSSNLIDLTISFTIKSAIAGNIFASGSQGTRVNYSELTTSRWSTLTESGNVTYSITDTSYSAQSGSRPGEWSQYSPTSYTHFDVEFRAKSNENLTTNENADFSWVWAYQDANNMDGFQFNGIDGNSFLWRVVNGSRTILTYANGDNLDDNSFHTMNIRYHPSTGLLITKDGSPVTFQDASIALNLTTSGGKHGPASQNDSASFDDIEITDISSTSVAATKVLFTGSGSTSFKGGGGQTTFKNAA